jgi:DNA-binding SARP family transcriptional activator
MNEQLTFDGMGSHEQACHANPGRFRRQSDNRAPDKQSSGHRAIDSDQTIPALSIFTLGRFSLLLDGKPVEFGRKVPRRPLELLKALVAAGGRDVSVTLLTNSLWPDVEGDSAQRSFDTTLHRLRKLLGDERVLVVREGKLSLASDCCWVDVWRFERLLGQSQRLLVNDMNGNEYDRLVQLGASLLSLYQGHFLGKEDLTSWSVSMHERLRSKYIHHLIEIGRYMEKHGHWEQAMDCYRKGMDLDDLVEVFYQRLMHCCLQTRRFSEGLAAYRRCQQVLSISLGLQPEPETESLYRSLCNSRQSRQSA